MRIAILGWGSLLWESETEQAKAFNRHRGEWLYDGPLLRLEFSRRSQTRDGALTLVLDYEHGGDASRVAYTLSTRRRAEDAICDLRCREGTVLRCIGSYFGRAEEQQKTNWADTPAPAQEAIVEWAQGRVDVVVWTALSSNMEREAGQTFLDAAKQHIKDLSPDAKAKAAEYVWRAPDFVDTPLRRELQSDPWFPRPAGVPVNAGDRGSPENIQAEVERFRAKLTGGERDSKNP